MKQTFCICNYSTLYAATLDSVGGSVNIGAIAGGVTGALIGVILTIIIVMVIISAVLTFRKKESSGKLFCTCDITTRDCRVHNTRQLYTYRCVQGFIYDFLFGGKIVCKD